MQLEDVASFGNDTFEAGLRENARAVLSHEYDNQVINGNGTSPNIEGIARPVEQSDESIIDPQFSIWPWRLRWKGSMVSGRRRSGTFA